MYSDLKVVFKRIIYPVLSWLVLFQFGYRGFSFLSHDVRLWFMVFSKLALVSLDYYSFPTGLKENLKSVKFVKVVISEN